MSIATIILGQSGTGKSASLRNLDPANTLLIQAIKKPLPFKSSTWKGIKEGGNILVSDNSIQICNAMRKTSRDVIVLDDFQYTMANEFMRRVTDQEAGASAFQKYNEIAKSAWDILNCASSLPDHKRVYILSHTQTDDSGSVKIKTIGKLLDEKITIEGMVSIVLRTSLVNGNFLFSTVNSGHDTTKAPIGLFENELIENDLAFVDAAIYSYYGLTQPKESNEK
jgi:hypothetical protein